MFVQDSLVPRKEGRKRELVLTAGLRQPWLCPEEGSAMQSIQAKCWHGFQPFLKRAGSKQQELSLAGRCLPCTQNPGTTECGSTEINQPWSASRKHKLLNLLLALCAYTDICMFSCLIISLLLSHPTPNPGTSFHQKTLASNFQSRISYLLSAPIPGSAVHPSMCKTRGSILSTRK